MTNILGWLVVMMSVLSTAISAVPGATMILGYLASLTMLAVAVGLIKFGHSLYFILTAAITGFGIILINCAFRLFWSVPETTWTGRLTAYFIYFIICLVGWYLLKYKYKNKLG